MPQHATFFSNGVIHYSTKDAVFRTINDKPVSMEFHRYCGPCFELDGDYGWLPEEGSKEWGNLWRQFDGWMNAKGHLIDPSPVIHNSQDNIIT